MREPLKVVECPYVPEGFVVYEDSTKFVVMGPNGSFEIPKIAEFPMPKNFHERFLDQEMKTVVEGLRFRYGSR